MVGKCKHLIRAENVLMNVRKYQHEIVWLFLKLTFV